jgi:isoamylase
VHGKPQRGSPTPHGASLAPGGVNFAVFSSAATSVSLVLYTPEDQATGRVTEEIELSPDTNRTARARARALLRRRRADAAPRWLTFTLPPWSLSVCRARAQGSTWHVLVPSLSPSMLYGFRVGGPSAPALGHRFNADAVVLDPYARGVASRPHFSQPAAGDNCWPQLAATLPDAAAAPFDWEGTTSPNRPLDDLVIYECHVRGFTKHPSSGASARVRCMHTCACTHTQLALTAHACPSSCRRSLRVVRHVRWHD